MAHLVATVQHGGPLIDYARLHDLDVKKLYVFKPVIENKLNSELGSESNDEIIPVKRPPERAHRGVGVELNNGVRLYLEDLSEPGLLDRLAQL